MAKARDVAYAVPGAGATAASRHVQSRHVQRLLVLFGLVAGAWLIGALLLSQPAHGAQAPQPPAKPTTDQSAETNTPAPQSPADPAPADPAPAETAPADPPTEEPAAEKPDGLIGGMVGRVTDALRDPVRAISEPVRAITAPVREVTAPIRGTEPRPKLPVVGDLLPSPRPSQPDDEPVRLLPSRPEAPVEGMRTLPLRPDQDAAAPASEPADRAPQQHPDARQARKDRTSVSTAQPSRRAASAPVAQPVLPIERTAQIVAATGQPSAPLPDPAERPSHEPSPASPAPPAPSAKINQAHGSNNDREPFAVLFGSGGLSLTAASIGELDERVHRGAAAPGLPAISPD